jgi:hypothetical protein
MVKIAPDKSLPQTKNRGQRLTLTMVADLLDRGGRQGIGLHGCGPVVASRWATAS